MPANVSSNTLVKRFRWTLLPRFSTFPARVLCHARRAPEPRVFAFVGPPAFWLPKKCVKLKCCSAPLYSTVAEELCFTIEVARLLALAHSLRDHGSVVVCQALNNCVWFSPRIGGINRYDQVHESTGVILGRKERVGNHGHVSRATVYVLFWREPVRRCSEGPASTAQKNIQKALLHEMVYLLSSLEMKNIAGAHSTTKIKFRTETGFFLGF